MLGPPAPPSVNACISAGLPALLAQLQQNVRKIYRSLKDAGFSGDLVAVTYYALNHNDPLTAAIKAVNGVLAEVTVKGFGGKIADGFTGHHDQESESVRRMQGGRSEPSREGSADALRP